MPHDQDCLGFSVLLEGSSIRFGALPPSSFYSRVEAAAATCTCKVIGLPSAVQRRAILVDTEKR